MASYISSNANRFYTAIESSYGQVPAITALNRVPALKLAIQQQLDAKDRKDKTGSRTFAWQKADQLRTTDVFNELGQDGFGPRIWTSGTGCAGRYAATLCRRHRGIVHEYWPTGIQRVTRVERGAGGLVRVRRDSLCCGDRGCEQRPIECAVHDRSRNGLQCDGSGYVWSGNRIAEREYLRLLGPDEFGAKAVMRGGRRSDVD